MGKIGNYVHLHLANYYKYGTKQEESKSTDFNANLFEAHHRQLRALVERQKIPNLDKIAEEYNKKNEAAWKMFAALDKKKPEDTNILQHLLHQINASWTDEFVDVIVSGLSWSNTLNTFVFNPPKNFKSQYTDTAIKGLPALRLSQDAKFHYITTLINYIDKFLQYLQSLDSESAVEDCQYLNKKKKDLKQVQTAMEGLTREQREIGKYVAFNNKNTLINKEFFATQQEELNQRREKYVGAAEINKQIQSAMAEIFGNIVAQDATSIGVDAVKKAINEAIGVGRKGSDAINVSKKNFINLSAEAIEENFIEAQKYVAMKEGRNNKYFSYRFSELGTSRAQKRDVELTIEDKTYGISVKNTQFANAYAKSQGQLLPPSTIHLQNSSLLLYLIGMEKDPSSMGLPNLGTHYLNALSEHPEGFDANIQQDALNSLKLYLLYSSLTGRGQLRNSTGAATILAIYDKASSKNTPIERIKLFDMSEIILTLDNLDFEQGVRFSPEINAHFLLPNKKVESDKGTGAAIQKRLTNVLLAARSRNIAVSLYTAFLRDKT